MEQRTDAIWEHGVYKTVGRTMAVVLMVTKDQLLGCWYDTTGDRFIPTCWNLDGTFVDKDTPRKLDLTKEKWT